MTILHPKFNRKEHKIRVILEEYRALRNEILDTIRHTYQIIFYITGGAIIIFSIAIRVGSNHEVQAGFLFLAAGFAGLLGLALWTAELTRRIRASLYINYVLKEKIKNITGDKDLLLWEKFLRFRDIRKKFFNINHDFTKVFNAHYIYFHRYPLILFSVIIFLSIGFNAAYIVIIPYIELGYFNFFVEKWAWIPRGLNLIGLVILLIFWIIKLCEVKQLKNKEKEWKKTKNNDNSVNSVKYNNTFL